ncbi:hypothetical protein KbCgl_26210 [Corynebacterium glutamicum]|nr:hypothetical protein KbCgl_26210 [Corynebacterium glutamicum]
MDYLHIDPATYDIGVQDQETAVFTTGDGITAHCFFEATPGETSYQIKEFDFDETAGTCAFGDQHISVTTDENVRERFAELSETEAELPEAQATLDAGEMVHLGHMGCWAPSVSEFSCLDFASNQAFTINEQGFHELDPAKGTEQLTNSRGQVQALSRMTNFQFTDGTSITCVSELQAEEFLCHNSGPGGWEATETGGPANTLWWNLNQADAEFEGARPTNPTQSVYKSQQVFGPGSYLLTNGVSAEFDGTTLTLTTPQGNQYWANTHDFGAGTH